MTNKTLQDYSGNAFAQYGGPELLQQARDLCQALEKLPPGIDQTKLISLVSDAAFGLYRLQETGEHFWPRSVAPSAQKPTPASIEAQVADAQFHQWPGSTMITCKITAKNGHEYTADSKPIDAADFTVERGQLEARKKAVAQLWDAEIYQYRTNVAEIAQ